MENENNPFVYYIGDTPMWFEKNYKKMELPLKKQRIDNYLDALKEINKVDCITVPVYCAPDSRMSIYSLVQLMAIADAWNKMDGFVPDFGNGSQYKWYPWFKYDKGSARFVYATSRIYTTACVNSRICFKTSEIAKQFAKQFIDLFKEYLLP